MKDFLTFNPKLPKLTANERKVLSLLVEAAKLIEPVYKQQENSKYASGNFYPHDLTKDEIEKAAKSNPEILSPYTIVEEENGKLVAIPYHVKYADLLKPVSDKLLKAAELTDNKEFAKRLTIQAQALLDGSYEKAYISWASMKPYVLDIVIGPVQKYDDKLLHVKTAYQAWVGIVDKEMTDRTNRLKEAILSAQREAMMPNQKIDFYDKVRVIIEDSLIFSGLMARTIFVGVFTPTETELLEKYGADITLSKPANDYRVEHEILPAFNKLFSAPFRKSFTKESITRGSMGLIFLHELSHAYLTYRSSRKNLQDLYPVISELCSTVTGVKVCGSLLLKDMVTLKELESIMVSLVSRSFYLIAKKVEDPFVPHYVTGGKIVTNYLLETGAIKISGGFVIPNFMKMFVSINELATQLEKLLAVGTRKEAESFIKKYSKNLSF